MNRKIILLAIFCSAFILVLYTSCSTNGKEDSGHTEHGEAGEQHKEEIVEISDKEIEEFNIEISTSSPGKLKMYLELPGEIVVNSDKLAHIVPRISGVAGNVQKNLGDNVDAGEVLASLESKELANIKSEYLASIQRLEIARANYKREKRLWDKKITPEQDYLNAKQSYSESQIAFTSAKQKLKALGFSDKYLRKLREGKEEDFTYYEIKSPFSGTIINKHIAPGELLKENDIAYTVSDLSSVWVNFTIYQKDLPNLNKGQAVVIKDSNGVNETVGEITYISPVLREDTRAATARVVLLNEDNTWKPGLFVSGQVATGDYDVDLAIPKTAIQTIDGKLVVFVKEGEGFKPQTVQTGRSDQKYAEIVSGLEPGIEYVSAGGLTLKAELQKESFGDSHAH